MTGASIGISSNKLLCQEGQCVALSGREIATAASVHPAIELQILARVAKHLINILSVLGE